MSQVLLRNQLAAVQLSVILDRDNSSNVIESYTFSFEYGIDPSTAMKHLKGTIFSRPRGEAVTVRTTLSGIWLISQHLMELSLKLPDLPCEHDVWKIILEAEGLIINGYRCPLPYSTSILH